MSNPRAALSAGQWDFDEWKKLQLQQAHLSLPPPPAPPSPSATKDVSLSPSSSSPSIRVEDIEEGKEVGELQQKVPLGQAVVETDEERRER